MENLAALHLPASFILLGLAFACLAIGVGWLQLRAIALYCDHYKQLHGRDFLDSDDWWENRSRRRDLLWELLLRMPVTDNMPRDLRSTLVWLRICAGSAAVIFLALILTRLMG